jgi:hypothetical protein
MKKPDFTGTWKFNPSKSLLQILAPDATEFVIDHREPLFRLSRTHVVGGKSDALKLELTTDGNEITGDHGELHFRSRIYWNGETLVFETNVVQRGETGVNTVRYTLSDTRDSILAEERFRSKNTNYDNKWVLDREQ